MKRHLLIASAAMILGALAASAADEPREGETITATTADGKVVTGRVVDPSTIVTRRVDDSASVVQQAPAAPASETPEAAKPEENSGGFFSRFARRKDEGATEERTAKDTRSRTAEAPPMQTTVARGRDARTAPKPEAPGPATAPRITPNLAATNRQLSRPADSRVVSAAANYTLFRDDVTEIGYSPIQSVGDIDNALETSTSYTPEDLTRGWIAYAALVAMQNPAFIDGVRASADHWGREDVMRGLNNNLAYAGMISGSELAIDDVLRQASSDAAKFKSAGDALEQQAYTIQKDSWASRKVANKEGKLAAVRQTSNAGAPSTVLSALAAPGAVGSPELEVRGEALNEFRRMFVPTASPTTQASYRSSYRLRPNLNQKSALDRAMTIAAFEALGATEEANRLRTGEIFLDRNTRKCLGDARLQLEACISATYNNFDVPFCVARHSISDVSSCISGQD